MNNSTSDQSAGASTPSIDPTLPMVLAASRTLVATLGGFAIARGWVGQDQASQMGGAIVVLITGAFAIYSQFRSKQHLANALSSTAGPVAPAAAANTNTGVSQ